MYLDKIYATRYKRIEELKKEVPLVHLKEHVLSGMMEEVKKRSFKQALLEPGISIIGEIKKASPSKGIFDQRLDPLKMAHIYEECGIRAISVLTEPDYFLGDYDALFKVGQISQLPILNKDFVFDPWQVYKAKEIGADAILLIATMLEKEVLRELYRLAHELEMDVLLEVHDEKDLEKTLAIDANIIGINNRSLQSFHVDIETTLRLSKHIPKDKLVVSESGIRNKEDLNLLKSKRIDGVLVGESFVTAKDIEGTVKGFVKACRKDRGCL